MTKRLVVLAVGGPLAVLLAALGQVWASGSSQDPVLGRAALSITGTQMVPAALGLALVVGAALVAMLTGGPRIRTAAGVLMALAALAVVGLIGASLGSAGAALGRRAPVTDFLCAIVSGPLATVRAGGVVSFGEVVPVAAPSPTIGRAVDASAIEPCGQAGPSTRREGRHDRGHGGESGARGGDPRPRPERARHRDRGTRAAGQLRGPPTPAAVEGVTLMAGNDHHDNHGQSVAAWTGVAILTVAAAIMCWAVVVASTGLFIAGAVLAVIGVVTGKVLAMAGFGVQKPGRNQVDSGVS